MEQKQWDKITCPVLIIHGGKHGVLPFFDIDLTQIHTGDDVTSPAGVAQQLYDLLRNADRQIHIIDGAPHLLTHTHYRQVCHLHIFFRIQKLTKVVPRSTR